jgi:hypothetical protein
VKCAGAASGMRKAEQAHPWTRSHRAALKPWRTSVQSGFLCSQFYDSRPAPPAFLAVFCTRSKLDLKGLFPKFAP